MKKYITFVICTIISFAFGLCISIMMCFTAKADNNSTGMVYGELKEYNGHYYGLYNIDSSWEEANASCQNLGGHLATISDVGENDTIYQLINTLPTYKGYWLGGNNDNGWKWITGEAFNYINFDRNEPNGSGNYLQIYTQNGKWDDTTTNGTGTTIQNHGFICEWDSADNVPKHSYDSSKYYNGHRYALYNIDLRWEEANARCQELGGHLATITDAYEDELIYKLIKSSPVYEGYWLGGVYKTKWEWITSEPFEYLNFDTAEPNGSGDYLQIYSNNGKWDDTTTDGTNALIKTHGFICEWDNVGKDGYLIQVVDEKGSPLSGASVSYDGQTEITGNDGIALLHKFTLGTPIIEIELNGYLPWTNKNSNWTKSANRFETVILYPEGSSDLKLKSVQYSSSKDMTHAVNLLTGTKKISLASEAPLTGEVGSGDFYISCVAGNTSLVQRYELWQGSKCIAQSSNGFFSLNKSSFAKGNDCFIRVVAKDLTNVDAHINLTFAQAQVVKETNIKLTGKSISVNLSDDVPFVGGSKLNVSLPMTIPLTYYQSEDKIQIGFNANIVGGKSEKEQYKDLKETVSQMKRLMSLKTGKLTGPQTRKFNALIKGKNKLSFFKGGEINVLGYAECDLGSTKASGSIVIQGKVDPLTFEHNMWVVVVPVTIQIKFSLQGTVGFDISYDWSSSTLTGDLGFAPSATLTAFGGIGVSKLVGVGAYGSAKLEGDIDILPEPYVKKVDLTGELGVKAYLAWAEYSKAFAYNTWHLYTGNTARGTLPEGLEYADDEESSEALLYQQLTQGMYDASLYRRANLNYLDEETDLMGDVSEETKLKARATDLRSEFKSLIQNTYRNAQPVMVSTGSAMYAAFLRGDSGSDRVYTVVSKYDGTNWKTAVATDANDALDSAPSLIADSEGNIWLAYARTISSYDNSTLLSYAQNQQIVVGRIDPNTLAFTESKVYNGDGYAHMQQLTLVNGKPTLVWVDSNVTDENSVLWPTGNRVYSATCSGTSWSSRKLEYSIDNVITSMTIGDANGRLSIACVVDEDSNYNTGDDHMLYTNLNGTLASLGFTCSGKVSYATLPGESGPVILWNDGNALHTSNGDVLTLNGINGEYAVSGNCVYYSVATDKGAELCMVKYENGVWSDPILLTEGSGYFENLNVVTLDGQDYVMGMYTNVSITEDDVNDSKDLVWTRVAMVSDLSIEDCDYDVNGIAAGNDVAVVVTVRNAGDHEVRQIGAYLDGSLVKNYDLALPVGQSTDITVPVTCPDSLTDFTITIGETGRSDYHPDDNEWMLRLGYADLAVTMESQQVGQRTTVYGFVTNEGIGSGSCTITFIGQDGAILSKQNVSNVQPGDVAMVSCDFSWDTVDGTGADVTAMLTCQQDDLYDYNNVDNIHIAYVGYRKISHPGAVLPAALRQIETEAFAGSHIRSVQLPEGIQSIGPRAFADCKYLEQIEIPDSVNSIADNAFEDTSGFVIFCPEGSFAASYANSHSLNCVEE